MVQPSKLGKVWRRIFSTHVPATDLTGIWYRSHGNFPLAASEFEIRPLRKSIRAIRVLAHQSFADLYCGITQQHAGLFVTTGGQQHPLDIRIPTSNWIDGPAVETIRDKWWLMAGDTDFR